MTVSKLETFVASLPSRKMSELLSLLFVNDRHYGSNALYVLAASDVGDVGTLREAEAAIRNEIDRRIPARQEIR